MQLLVYFPDAWELGSQPMLPLWVAGTQPFEPYLAASTGTRYQEAGIRRGIRTGPQVLRYGRWASHALSSSLG